MEENNSIKNVKEKIEAAMELSKCRKCGCMKESLVTIKSELLKDENNHICELLSLLENSLEKMESTKYT